MITDLPTSGSNSTSQPAKRPLHILLPDTLSEDLPNKHQSKCTYQH